MNKVLAGILTGLLAVSTVTAFANSTPAQELTFTAPNPTLTPGKLCTTTDPNFSGYRYPTHVAYCNRNVSGDEKLKVAEAYGIPKSDWSKYEFDHLIPLNAGGSDDFANIWPEPLAEAHEKDKVELDVFDKLTAGKIDQAQAVQEIRDWFSSRATVHLPPAIQPSIATPAANVGANGIPDFIQVNDHLFRGGRPTQAGLNLLSADKIKTIIDIENDPAAINSEKSAASQLNVAFYSSPMDWTSPPPDSQIQDLLKKLQDPKLYPVFIHCKHGEDRTGLVMGLYRVKVDGWQPQDAYHEMLDNGFHPNLRALDNYFRQQTGYKGN